MGHDVSRAAQRVPVPVLDDEPGNRATGRVEGQTVERVFECTAVVSRPNAGRFLCRGAPGKVLQVVVVVFPRT